MVAASFCLHLGTSGPKDLSWVQDYPSVLDLGYLFRVHLRISGRKHLVVPYSRMPRKSPASDVAGEPAPM